MRTPWQSGNRLRLIEDGEQFFPRVLELVAQARTSIYIETFILAEDEVGRELGAALIDAAGRGVSVDILVDGFGSEPLTDAFRAELAEAGARLHMYEPRTRLLGWRTNLFRRMHRKITLIDTRIALVGGINFCRDQLVESGPEAMRDFAVEVEGPVVADIAQFAQDSNTSPRLPWLRWWRRRRQDAPSATREDIGPARVRFVTRDNRRHRSAIEREYRRAIASAREEIVIANAYFFPGYRLLRALRTAARRGVRVVLILQGRPDMQIVSVVARWLYDYLVPAGVRILEYRERPLHAKVAVVDGNWSTVGSSNLDPLSLSLNLEANLFIDDPAFRDQLRGRLQRLMDKDCCPVTPDRLPRRTAWRVLTTGLAFHFLRHFPKWAGWIPAHRPHIEAPSPEPEDAAEAAEAEESAQPTPPTIKPWWHRALWTGFAILVAVLLWRAAVRIDWPAAGAALSQRSISSLVLVGLAAMASHALYGTLDVLGRGYARHRLARWRAWLTATVCYALGLNLGALVGGVGLRLRLYREQGVSTAAAARVAFASISGNWAGYLALLAVAPFWASPEALSRWSGGLGAWPFSLVGATLLGVYLVQSARQREWRWRGRAARFPPLRTAVSQCLVAAANWALMAAVLRACLGGDIAYADVLMTLLFVAVAGAISHIPGGWGVLEFGVVAMLSHRRPAADLIAGVLVYRALYYLLPLAWAALGYLWIENGPAAADNKGKPVRQRRGAKALANPSDARQVPARA